RADAEPPRHVDELRIRSFIERNGARLERHAADRARPRLVAHDFRMHRARVLDGCFATSGFRLRASGLKPGAWSLEPEVLLRIRLESLETPFAAEVVGATLIVVLSSGLRRVDRHSADRIDFAPLL